MSPTLVSSGEMTTTHPAIVRIQPRVSNRKSHENVSTDSTVFQPSEVFYDSRGRIAVGSTNGKQWIYPTTTASIALAEKYEDKQNYYVETMLTGLKDQRTAVTTKENLKVTVLPAFFNVI